MALVQMKCPNCGGAMRMENNQFVCTNCRTMMLNIIDAKIDSDVTVMSPEEFARKLEESKRQFVVNINDNLQVFDINTMVVNKKIKEATELLARGDFFAIEAALSGVSQDILSAERLRYLSSFSVKNEYELSYHDGYIDNDIHYANIIRLADEQTKATYQKIAQYCREKYDTKKRIESEIIEVEKLLDNELHQEAIAYTKEMCRRYPYTAMSWAYACEVKCSINSGYNCSFEFSIMEKCPDYAEIEFPELLNKRITDFGDMSNKYSKKHNEHIASIGGIAASLWALTALVTLMTVSGISGIRNGCGGAAGGVVALLYLPCLIAFGRIIYGLVNSVKTKNDEKKLKEQYNSLARLVPNRVKEKYKVVFSDNKKKSLYIFAIIAWGIALLIAVSIIKTYF